MSKAHDEQPNAERKHEPFTSALSKLVSVPRAEVLRRVAAAPIEKTSRHKRYKFVPEVNPGKP